ncbi:MAG: ribbon-helix-helix protein, CopG family [Thermofilum sp.]
MSEGVKEIKVRLPRSIYERVLEKVRRKGYMSVAEYVRDLLRKEMEEG